MKICVDARVLGINKYAGIASYLGQFLRICSKKNGIELIAFSDKNIEVPANVRLVSKNVNSTFIWDQFVLPRLIKECGADVFLNTLLKAPLSLSCPMAWIINDLNHFVSIPEFRNMDSWMRKTYFGFFARQAIKKLPAIGAISSYTAKLFAEEFHYPLDKISIINLSVESGQGCEKNVAALKQKYALPDRFILYLGNFRKHKNISTLLAAYAKLPEDLRYQVGLVLAGEKEFEYESLRGQIRMLNIPYSVIFTGPILSEDKPLLYKLADIFVLPSVSEGFGLPLLEAMSQGTVVLASNSGALPEIVEDKDLLFPAKDAQLLSNKLSELLNNPESMQSLQKKSLERAKHFTQEKTTEQILELCRAACNSQKQ
jgi:glycosyltransferase involved in cell wall biosynthesis